VGALANRLGRSITTGMMLPALPVSTSGGEHDDIRWNSKRTAARGEHDANTEKPA
jgi:hypothetical protein